LQGVEAAQCLGISPIVRAEKGRVVGEQVSTLAGFRIDDGTGESFDHQPSFFHPDAVLIELDEAVIDLKQPDDGEYQYADGQKEGLENLFSVVVFGVGSRHGLYPDSRNTFM